MIELQRDTLQFFFPDLHPDAECEISFQRTLRIPDDGKTWPLPPGLGQFPIVHVDDFAATLPPEWKERGGVAFPMYQSEAMWIAFSGNDYPFAVKIAAGKIAPNVYKVPAVLDLDGDGKMEIVVGSNYLRGRIDQDLSLRLEEG